MARIDPGNAAQARNATTSDDAEPEVIAGRQVRGSALFAPCRTFRYRLTRTWDGGQGCCVFAMLNPSTADAVRVDPTVRRATTFAMTWGYHEIVVWNAFALRATAPKHLYTHADPVGPDNDRHLVELAAGCDRLVLAWGNHAALGDRHRRIATLLRPWAAKTVHLGLTAAGQPRHPLYVRGDTEPVDAAGWLAGQ